MNEFTAAYAHDVALHVAQLQHDGTKLAELALAGILCFIVIRFLWAMWQVRNFRP